MLTAVAVAVVVSVAGQDAPDETERPEPAATRNDDVDDTGDAPPPTPHAPADVPGADVAVDVDDAAVEASEGAVPGAPQERELSDTGRLGVALMGLGAAVAASTAAGAVLIEAVSRDDSNFNGPPKNPELVQVGGFATLTLMSLSAGVMLVGGALLADDVLTGENAPGPTAPPAP